MCWGGPHGFPPRTVGVPSVTRPPHLLPVGPFMAAPPLPRHPLLPRDARGTSRARIGPRHVGGAGPPVGTTAGSPPAAGSRSGLPSVGFGALLGFGTGGSSGSEPRLGGSYPGRKRQTGVEAQGARGSVPVSLGVRGAASPRPPVLRVSGAASPCPLALGVSRTVSPRPPALGRPREGLVLLSGLWFSLNPALAAGGSLGRGNGRSCRPDAAPPALGPFGAFSRLFPTAALGSRRVPLAGLAGPGLAPRRLGLGCFCRETEAARQLLAAPAAFRGYSLSREPPASLPVAHAALSPAPCQVPPGSEMWTKGTFCLLEEPLAGRAGLPG